MRRGNRYLLMLSAWVASPRSLPSTQVRVAFSLCAVLMLAVLLGGCGSETAAKRKSSENSAAAQLADRYCSTRTSRSVTIRVGLRIDICDPGRAGSANRIPLIRTGAPQSSIEEAQPLELNGVDPWAGTSFRALADSPDLWVYVTLQRPDIDIPPSGRIGPIAVKAGDLFEVDTSGAMWRVITPGNRTLASGRPKNWSSTADFLSVKAHPVGREVEVGFVLDRTWDGHSKFGIALVRKEGQGNVPTRSISPNIKPGQHSGSFKFRPPTGITKFFLLNAGKDIPTSKSFAVPGQ
jgi:hypothetical protein